jgi:hypothetical protein
MDKPWKVIFAFVGVFVAGAVFGGLFTLRASRVGMVRDAGKGAVASAENPVSGKDPAARPVSGPATPVSPVPAGDAGTPVKVAAPPANPAQGRIAVGLMRQFTQRLSPTPEQKKKFAPIFGRAAEDLQRLQREHLQDTTRVTERMYEDIAGLLSPDQRLQLEKMRQEMLERVRKEREKRGELQAKGGAGRSGPVAPSAKQQGP